MKKLFNNKNNIIWLTGQSEAGKTSIARKLSEKYDCIVLDGDEMRECVSNGLGLSKKDRQKNNLRVAKLASVLSRQKTVIVASIAPQISVRDAITKIYNPIWIYVKRTLPDRDNHFYEESDYFMLDHDKLSLDKSFEKLQKYLYEIKCII